MQEHRHNIFISQCPQHVCCSANNNHYLSEKQKNRHKQDWNFVICMRCENLQSSIFNGFDPKRHLPYWACA